MATNRETLHTITEILTCYFDGLHHGDTAKLRGLFHSDTVLKAPGTRRTLDEWLHAVDTRPVPAREGYAYRFRILSIEIVEDQAMAKVECPLFEHFYIDYLGLLKEDGQWRIVSKMYTDVANQPA